MPIPAAIVAVSDGAMSLEAANEPFRRAGLGASLSTSPLLQQLGAKIDNFLASRDLRANFLWQLGDAVDCRYFKVSLARCSADHDTARCMVSLIDQTGEYRTEHSLRREMMTDSLTGLPNRAGFGDLIESRVGASDRADYAVLVINLDRFSRVNACMGAVSGDELLISVARRLKGALRGRDVLARTGGDEFAVLLQMDEGPVDAMQVAKRIQRALTDPFRLSDFEIRVDCAIGVALGADAENDVEDMIRHAQFAVKRAKKTGRTEVYESKVFRVARAQFSIETELRRAVENGAMSLSFQPICDLATGKIVSFESLARWRTEAGADLSPSDFIPVAEESGLIVPLGRWAMEEAARTLAEWDRASGGDCGVKVAVNLSAIQLQRDQVPAMVSDALAQHGIDGSRLTLELTESAIVSDPDRIARTMRELKDLGATLAMDDFGTGYSNLAYLQSLPIDVLKIDRSFVTGMLADRDKVAIVRAILSLATALGMRTTAEGVESNELSQTLAALGCAYGQGYVYAKPLPADEAYQLLVERNA
ncbi:putative bifunctional diguanylate cyclase/phosphodiesterase [Stakelama marina]|uniref:Bifunctional diguanylate cyclase/phosphodiesterase n=1 Tax=Stakelama marina TaxID=2826939 RepID=A0A8T4I9L0_9SPHN|nr:bifunctional diguanylate cyclase/phosphodiesterase [Stakelama marina]MBR0551317.1 bifunctional diguanylate cyclase/phosphodiesterase [Stakelama marina]